MRLGKYFAFRAVICVSVAIAFVWAAAFGFAGAEHGQVVYADAPSEENQKPDRFEVEATRQWRAKQSFAVSGGPASLAWRLRPVYKDSQTESWMLMLVNKENLLPDDYRIETRKLSNGLSVDTRIYDPLMEFLEAGNEAGCALLVCSAYRSQERQTELYEADIAKYMGMGYSYKEACAITEQTLAVPGSSEHQAGLAVDIVTARHQVLNDAFADTKAGKWLAAHAHEYGFILRYPKDKEDITGIDYEPWHFRYVGKDAAERIYETGSCLEEYLEDMELIELAGE